MARVVCLALCPLRRVFGWLRGWLLGWMWRATDCIAAFTRGWRDNLSNRSVALWMRGGPARRGWQAAGLQLTCMRRWRTMELVDLLLRRQLAWCLGMVPRPEAVRQAIRTGALQQSEIDKLSIIHFVVRRRHRKKAWKRG